MDKDAVNTIKKKLDILNKVQSSYKGQDKGFEIETVNEVLNEKRWNKINELDVKQISLSKVPILQNFKNIRTIKPNRSLSEKIQSKRKNPLLVLQTDDLGFSRLRKSQKDRQKSKSVNSLEPSGFVASCSTIFENSNETKRRSISIDFDQCEISEKVTTV